MPEAAPAAPRAAPLFDSTLLYSTLGVRRGKGDCQGVVLSVLFYSNMLYYMLRYSFLLYATLLDSRGGQQGGCFQFYSYLL